MSSKNNIAASLEGHLPKEQLQRLEHTKESLHTFLRYVAAFKHDRHFQVHASKHHAEKHGDIVEQGGNFAAGLTPLFIGISAVFSNENITIVAIAIHDSVYLLDFSVDTIELSGIEHDPITVHVVKQLQEYEHKNLAKFIGATLPNSLVRRCPNLCSRLWLDLDIVPISIVVKTNDEDNSWDAKDVDEQADSMARKCIMHFGPSLIPLLQVGYRGLVEVDAEFQAQLLTLDDFKTTCGTRTWDSMMKFVKELKSNGTKLAFFSSTPQGGGVALMRHALVRLARQLGVDLKWYVPKPKPGVFRITKTMHNILQGVSKPDEQITTEQKVVLTEWIRDNAERYWLSKGGPLRPPSEGGADVIVIDDPQMPGLIPLIKNVTPDRPVLFRSHIQIRSDLADKEGTPQNDVWAFLFANIQHADMFIAHPIATFVPKSVPRAKVAFMPATTDWLDGLNKPLSDWDRDYYGNIYNQQAYGMRMTELKWPNKEYIIQIARFDPAKGIPDLVLSYAEFRKLLQKHYPSVDFPQLVICGNSSVDDPDGSAIYDQTMAQLTTHYPHLLNSVSVMRLNPNDQQLNALISTAHIALQLSTREGFEVKVSEAIHKGKPTIATNCGGIPLQVQHGKNGFLVEPGDWKAVAGHLLELWTDEVLYERMSAYAKISVSDEVGTVGNALAWLYLAARWADGKGVRPEGKWVNDLAREDAGIPYDDRENRLPRDLST